MFKKAAKAKQVEITFRDGSTFTLEYRTFTDRLDNKKLEKVWVKPKDKNMPAPCGWFTIEKI